MRLEPIQYLLGAISGSLVGLSLGLFGGGGSILAVPLLIGLVGLSNAHLAIGTSAVGVGASALINLIPHARAGNVRWRCALVAGAHGSWGGSSLGKSLDGNNLLLLFAVLMPGSASSCCSKAAGRRRSSDCRREDAPKTIGLGALAGAFSGFFGIGGGFLIVPALIAATGMPLIVAIGSSLVAVFAFGATTAANYALSELVDWPLAALFVLGGAAGSRASPPASRTMAPCSAACSPASSSSPRSISGSVPVTALMS